MPTDDRSREQAPAEPGEPSADSAASSADEERDEFVKGVLTRGEAAAPDEDLEPGQTHEVVERDGHVTVRRRRFSATD